MITDSLGTTLLRQASEDISKYLFQMKILLYGDGGELNFVLKPPQSLNYDFPAQRTHHNLNSSLNSLKKFMRTIFYNFWFFIFGDSNSR